ncbi:transcription-repair coupling factor [Glaciecola sp. MH2013]|uniref:transcription-repair coupling factor n=1 Tax=Glaciecola sp. MH2013 TaxID=2785524 RepID=UPI00189DDD09|nr:transcription-repair coupling factor [Glaciecola sp. MH2013]MBF7072962.1 transcription-repair coupling factor [Glaciecola sp. MH2013]
MANLLNLPLPKTRSTSSNDRIVDHIHWGELHGASQALSIAKAANAHHGPLIVVTEDSVQAIKLEKELAFFLRTEDIHVQLFPDWETLPYDGFSPHQDIVSQRLETLYLLSKKQAGIFIVPMNTLLQRLAPVEYVGQHLLYLKVGERIDTDHFKRKLEKSGYLHVSQVMTHSEFSVRGSIVDLFPMGSDQPFRIDLFDDEIDSIRFFDPETQRSLDQTEEIRLLPAREFPTDKDAITGFRERYLEKFERSNTADKESIFYQVSKGTMPSGIEYYLPLFFRSTASLFDYLHDDSLIFCLGDMQAAADQFTKDLEQRYEQYRYNLARPLLAPIDLYLNTQELLTSLKQWPRAFISDAKQQNKAGKFNFSCKPINNIDIDLSATNPYRALQAEVKKAKEKKKTVIFCAESEGRKENLIDVLAKAKIYPSNTPTLHDALQRTASETSGKDVYVCIGMVENSFEFIDDNNGFLFITETQLLGHKVSRRKLKDKRKATDEAAIVRNLAELSEGQPVVHIDHGVGRFLGLQTLDAGGVTTEYLTILYAKEAKLYVPVSSLHLISRYSGGDPEHAPIHNLGNDTWSKAKQKAAEKVRDVAAQLLDVYAKRAAKPGYAYPIDWQEYHSFEDSFPFEETVDQKSAINAVLQDMGSPNAMDRLVCGDVGFGKTEVAMRAAFIAASTGKQVAILVPTTLLAQQHFENFKNRFAQWPFKIEVISRFGSSKEQKLVIDDLASGQADIVVGTHKLLQDDVKFKDLGLVIIDEEHRFGVRQKEKFKALRADVDILTLTATPIPRTLNMALSGMRDLSIIATPPAKRLAIKTFVQMRQQDIIREAIMREILRGGQVYFLHNEVKTIEKTAREIEEIIPEARIAIGHGQMRERELEAVMNDFYHQRYNVLVCTTIVETGIDVPTANTIIMDRADHLGLAQLHQLRGRVGRSHHQAYAYLLTPHPKRMTKDASKRLEAIASLEDLGAGFALATHDLEIRGAGELLGDDQSGQINTIGFSLYMDMLEQAVEALKEGKEPSLDDVLAAQTEVDLRIPALLPDDYIGDVNTRLSLYKKLANCKTQNEIDEYQIELIDRFGLLPQSAKNLVRQSGLKLTAQKLGIRKIETTHTGGSIEFEAKAKIDPGYLIQLIQKFPSQYKFDGPQKLRFMKKLDSAQQKLDHVRELLDKFVKECHVG